MDRGKRIIGIVLIIVSIGALIAWEKWGKAQLLYDEVLVCRENVTKGTVLTAEMLDTVRMDVQAKGWLSPKEMKAVVGKEAAAFIHKDMPLFPEYFDQSGLSASGKDGKYVMAVPEDWLDSAPSSIYRGDTAYFYSGSKFLTSAPVSAVDQENRKVEIVVSHKQAAQISAARASGSKLVLVYS